MPRSTDAPPPRPAARREVGRAAALLALLVGLVYAATVATTLTNDDASSASLGAWRIATTGTPWLEGLDTAAIGIARADDAFVAEAANGHEVVHRSPGVVAAGVPAYLLAGGGTDPAEFSLVPGALTAAA